MANAQFKAEYGIVTGSNSASVLDGILTITGNTVINADAVIISGNLTILGNLNYTDIGISGNLNPDVDQSWLGNTTHSWSVSGYTVRSFGGIFPMANTGRAGGYSQANSVPLGNSTNRFAAALSTASISGNLTTSANANIGGGALIVNASSNTVGINAIPNTSFALVVGGAIKAGSIDVGALDVSGVGSNGVLISTNAIVVTNTSANPVDSIPIAQARIAKYVVGARQGANSHSMEIVAVNDGSNTVQMSRYGEVYNTFLGGWNVDVAGANLVLYFTANVSGSVTVSTVRITMA